MLQLSTAMMNGPGNPTRAPRSRTGTPDRGGIRKRGRIDRDGDLDMAAGGGSNRGRGRKSRGQSEPSRRMPVGAPGRPGRRPGNDKDKTLDALQKAIFNGSTPQANIRQTRSRLDNRSPNGRGGLAQIKIRGWKDSKVASNADGGIDNLISFLERKATPPPDTSSAAHVRLKISKSRVEGDALIISVRPEQVDWVLRINGFTFAGAHLTIELHSKPGTTGSPAGLADGPSQAAVDTKAKMTAFLGKRYSEARKLLDLSNLGTDTDLIEMGMFNSVSTESKFFPALMKVCELTFDTPEKKRVAVESVSLAHNNLVNVVAVTTLAQTFPDLRNLDLSSNQIKDSSSLSNWRWKFRDLDFLDLSGNPISMEQDFKDTMLKWYPKLRILNNAPVRTEQEIAASKKKMPIPVLGPSFQDESSIAENFVKAFFTGFDNDRNDILNGIYDASSVFSFNINVSAPRGSQTESTASWDPYIKKSRNLSKIHHLTARMSRSFVGVENIREIWNSFPKTRHPDILTNPKEWLIECHPIPGLPDLAGNSSTGVGGLLITTHGKFDELDPVTGKKNARSFDRTFVLGPGTGVGGLRVSNDMLCLRAHGGCQAWVPETEIAQPTAPAAAAMPTAIPAAQNTIQPTEPLQPARPPHPEATNGYGLPAPGKTDDQLKKEQLVLEISFRTKMTLSFSEMALSGNNWDLTAALKNFEQLKSQGQLPSDAYLSGV